MNMHEHFLTKLFFHHFNNLGHIRKQKSLGHRRGDEFGSKRVVQCKVGIGSGLVLRADPVHAEIGGDLAHFIDPVRIFITVNG